jgi:hypothetical protein
MKGAGESPQTVGAFLGVVRDSLADLKQVKKDDKAVEAAKFRSYQSSPFRPKAPSPFRSSNPQEGGGSRKAPLSKGKKFFPPRKTRGKAKGPASRRGEGQKKR